MKERKILPIFLSLTLAASTFASTTAFAAQDSKSTTSAPLASGSESSDTGENLKAAKEALQGQIDEAGKYTEATYGKYSSWETFKNAYETANTLSNSTDIEQIKTATEALKGAIDALKGEVVSASSSHHGGGGGGNNNDDEHESIPTKPSSPSTPSQTFVSDTTNDLTVNGTYQFRITSKNGKTPVFVVGTSGVFDVKLARTTGNDYFFKITAIGAPGDKAGIYINGGSRFLVATVGSNPNYAKLDTGKQLSVKAGKTYQFKVTAAKRPSFVCGTGSTFRVAYAGSKGNDYFFKVTATGKVGDKAGFYVNGEKAPRTIGTIVK